MFLAKKRKAYEPKNIREKKQEKDLEKVKGKESASKVLKGSKKVKKTSISPKTRSRNNSCDSDLGILGSPSKRKNSQGNDVDNRKIRKLVRASETEVVFVENWLQCDECGKWRKITDGKVKFFRNILSLINLLEILWKKLQSKSNLTCKCVPGIVCKSTEENWKQTYITIAEKVKES